MTDEIDIYRAAHMFIQRHGDSAEEVALAKMRKFMDEEEVVGASTWLMIAQAIAKLKESTPGGTVH